MNKLIYSIYIDIPDSNLDNPAPYDENGVQEKTNKSIIAKRNFLRYKDKLIDKQQEYAKLIGADYKVMTDSDHYQEFVAFFKKFYPQISHYDIINFYKHQTMFEFAEKYDYVCYLDLDIVPNTTEDIFSAFDIDNSFAVPDSNTEAFWGKTVEPKYYNTCIRNPATKYWNAHAMLAEVGLPPDQNVYNTGIMIASSQIIKKLHYFKDFEKTLDLMTYVKNDSDSMYPKNIQRVFNYDNETVFSYMLTLNDVPVTLIGKDWHHVIRTGEYDPNAKMFHVIDKVFARFFR